MSQQKGRAEAIQGPKDNTDDSSEETGEIETVAELSGDPFFSGTFSPVTSTPKVKMTELDAKVQALTEELKRLRAGFSDQKRKMDSISQATGNQSLREQVEKPPLPPKYDGSFDFNTYLVQFEVLTKEQKWGDQT